jgi:hypothetical protein
MPRRTPPPRDRYQFRRDRPLVTQETVYRDDPETVRIKLGREPVRVVSLHRLLELGLDVEDWAGGVT